MQNPASPLLPGQIAAAHLQAHHSIIVAELTDGSQVIEGTIKVAGAGDSFAFNGTTYTVDRVTAGSVSCTHPGNPNNFTYLPINAVIAALNASA